MLECLVNNLPNRNSWNQIFVQIQIESVQALGPYKGFVSFVVSVELITAWIAKWEAVVTLGKFPVIITNVTA